MNAYEVTIDTTNASTSKFKDIEGNYHTCRNGKVIVVTDSPSEIFTNWGGIVKSVKKLGVGEFMTTNPQIQTKAVWIGSDARMSNSKEERA